MGVTTYDIIGYCFIALLLACAIAISVYLFIYYSHPLDKDIPGIWVLRVVIILGLVIAIMMTFLLPIDYLCAYQT